jgi:hypothetical protein
VFCDKGAERKARDEERRASKRRTTPSGKRRLDEMYHTPLERSEFYSMAELGRSPVRLKICFFLDEKMFAEVCLPTKVCVLIIYCNRLSALFIMKIKKIMC